MKSVISAFSSAIMIALAVFVVSVTSASKAAADAAGETTDPTTGYRCVSPGCMSVRLPDADCICVKRNPGETDARKVLLACSTRESGHWVACPVKPRYGIPTR
ncbi:hypothetical protein [Mesorhizobium koreense]|uniref:hypothetical protein n=1 Tax=Mesorhizobium koreense TaxID=3074855 RepID=UPI00287BA24E|nr:hypothetical protein [Mesorhizobium sp. WR6]